MIARRLRISADPQIPSKDISAQDAKVHLIGKKAATGGELVAAFVLHSRDPFPKERSHRDAGGCVLIENERGPH
jgi:hypothetical protein